MARRACRVLRHRRPVLREPFVVRPSHHRRARTTPDTLAVGHHLLVDDVLGEPGHVVAGPSREPIHRQADPGDDLSLRSRFAAVAHRRAPSIVDTLSGEARRGRTCTAPSEPASLNYVECSSALWT